MDNETLFYVFGIAAAISAVAVTFAGLRLKDFPGKALPVVILWFAFLVVGATTFSVLHAQDEEHHEAAEAAEKIEEGETPGPYENEGGALGGEREELEEEAEEEGEGSPEEEEVGPTEGSQQSGSSQGKEDSGGSAEAPTTLQLAADPAQIAYDKTELSAKAGKVTIDFENPSAVPHNVVIEKDGKELAGTPEIAEGKESVSVELEAGSYTFVCTVPGHEELGMVGTLEVQ